MKLRQAIQKQAFEGINDAVEADQIRYGLLDEGVHAGLRLNEDDSLAIIEDAYASGNVGLWVSFYTQHHIYSKEYKRSRIRFRMRQQAHETPSFMAAWMVRCRESKLWRKQSKFRGSYRHSWRFRRQMREKAANSAANFKYLQEHRGLIERGEHGGWLKYFARRYVKKPGSLSEIVDDDTLPVMCPEKSGHVILFKRGS